jgi:hypothetical protein
MSLFLIWYKRAKHYRWLLYSCLKNLASNCETRDDANQPIVCQTNLLRAEPGGPSNVPCGTIQYCTMLKFYFFYRYAKVAAQKLTQTVIETAIKGGGGIVQSLQRSYSMNDLNSIQHHEPKKVSCQQCCGAQIAGQFQVRASPGPGLHVRLLCTVLIYWE